MSVSAQCLIQSQYIPNVATVLYTSPANTNTIIDKFTVVNATAGSVNFSVHIVPNGDTATAANLIVDTDTLAAHTPSDLSYMQNQILNIGDSIAVVASAANSIVIRCSGRQVA